MLLLRSGLRFLFWALEVPQPRVRKRSFSLTKMTFSSLYRQTDRQYDDRARILYSEFALYIISSFLWMRKLRFYFFRYLQNKLWVFTFSWWQSWSGNCRFGEFWIKFGKSHEIKVFTSKLTIVHTISVMKSWFWFELYVFIMAQLITAKFVFKVSSLKIPPCHCPSQIYPPF